MEQKDKLSPEAKLWPSTVPKLSNLKLMRTTTKFDLGTVCEVPACYTDHYN